MIMWTWEDEHKRCVGLIENWLDGWLSVRQCEDHKRFPTYLRHIQYFDLDWVKSVYLMLVTIKA